MGKYSNTIYGFDIETTTIENEISTLYLCGFEHCELFNDNIQLDCYCRNFQEIDCFLNQLNCFAGNKTILCYSHNLAYEFDFFVKNSDFIKEHFNNEKCLFLKSRIPLFVLCDKLELRCSFKLLNKSIEMLGKELNLPKLEINYSNRFFDFSELPIEEYEYNKRDIDIMLLSINRECAHWNWISTADNIPLTYTGFTRKNNRRINDKKTITAFISQNNFQKHLTDNEIDFLENLFSGGYTHANAFNAFKLIENVHSIDINSSYPFQMLYRYFPYTFKKIDDTERAQRFFERLQRINDFNFFAPQVQQYYFFGTFKITNLEAKRENNNIITPISFSKCDDWLNVDLDNGRILNADYVILPITNIDLINIEMFYKFDKIEVVSDFSYTANLKSISDYVKNSVLKYLDDKNDLKQQLKENPDNDDLRYLYGKKKECLNSQYGQNVEKIKHFDINYNTKNDEYEINNGEFSKVYYRNFINGIFITAYARLHLFYFAKTNINDINIIYTDTDSWKFNGDYHLIDDFNNKLENAFKPKYQLGYYDFEGTSDYFITLGCKKYVTIKNGEVRATVSGVPKKKTSDILTEALKELNGDLEQFQNLIFSPNTIISGTITGKLASKYFHNEYYILSVTDENGKQGEIMGYKGVTLVNIDYTLLNTLNYVNKKYVKFCEELQGREIPDLYSIIERKNNKLILRFLTYTEFKKLTSHYKLKNKQFELTVEDEESEEII